MSDEAGSKEPTKPSNRIGIGMWIILGLIAVGAYQIFYVGDPEAKRFFDECRRNELSSLPRNATNDEYRTIVMNCNQRWRARKDQ